MPLASDAARRAGRILTILLALSASLTLSTAAADGAVRYAAPGGGIGPNCPQAAPCEIGVAIEGAGNGDEVIVEPGIHPAGANEIDATATNLVIHGGAAGAKPEITSTGTSGIRLLGANSIIRDVKLTHTNSTGLNAGLFVDGTTAERVEVTSTGTFGCALASGGTIRDSVCRSTSPNSAALGVLAIPSTIGYARNVTAVSTGANAPGALVLNFGSGTAELDARNVITQGLPDVSVVNSGTGTSTATMTYSSYVTTQPPNSATTTITPAGTATNITALPQFVNAPGGDFRQVATSPTRNAGATDSRTGTLDFDGESRPQGVIDIGADEFTEPAPPVADVTAPNATIDKGPKKKTKSKKATFQFSADDAGARFTCKLDGKAFAACASPAKYKRLKKGKHSFSVVATDAAGNADATPATYRWKVKRKPKT